MASPGDYLRKVQPGETLESIPRDAYNAFVDAALANRGTGFTGAGNGADFNRRLDIVTVKNTTAAAVDRFGVLELTTPQIAAADFLSEFLRVVNFNGVAPAGTGVSFCILLEPLAQNATGKGVVSGVVPCQITGTAGGKLAGPKVGDTTALEVGRGGTPVLWQEAGAAKRWAYVLLSGSGAGPWVRCRKVVTDVYCLANQLYYTAEFDYIDAAEQIVKTNSTPCGVSLTVASVTNGTCTACTSINASFNLLQTSPTTWAYSGGLAVCTGFALSMTLTLAAGTLTLLVKSGATTIATYTNSSPGAYDGTSSIVVTRISNSGACATWPSTLTISAV